jgi:flagellar motor switch protein FliG
MTILPAPQSGHDFDGAEKVTAILLMLDREASNRILRHFNQDELRRIARVAATMKSVTKAALESICVELIDAIEKSETELAGGLTVAEALLTGALPEEQVAEIMSDVREGSNAFFWRRIDALSDRTLADFLATEHPQAIAIVLARIDVAAAARVLALLPGSLRALVMVRMLTARPVADPVLRVVEEFLREDLLAVASAPSSAQASTQVAGIVNQLEREQVNEILSGIAQIQPQLAQQLKSLLFSFEDIVRLNQRARTIVFDQAPTEQVILALRGAAGSLRDAILPCLSARTRRMVEAELASNAETPRSDVLAAQREIANLVLSLANRDLIDLTSGDKESAP